MQFNPVLGEGELEMNSENFEDGEMINCGT